MINTRLENPSVMLVALLSGSVIFCLVNLAILINLSLDLLRKKQSHIILLLALSLTDLAGAASFPVFVAVLAGLLPSWTACSATVFINRTAIVTSGGLVTLIAGERLSAMGLPFWYERHVTPLKTSAVAIVTVVIGNAISACSYRIESRYSPMANASDSNSTNCFILPLTLALEPTGFLLPFTTVLAVIIVLNIVLNAASTRIIQRLRQTSQAGPNGLRHEEALMRLVLCVSATFVVTNLPACVMLFAIGAGVTLTQPPISVCAALFTCAYVTDPAIHLALTPRYRRRIRYFFTCAFRHFRQNAVGTEASTSGVGPSGQSEARSGRRKAWEASTASAAVPPVD